MPTLKARCPECDARVRRTVDEPGEYKMKCPDCGHAFFAELQDEADDRPTRRRDEDGRDDRPARYKPREAGKSNTPIVVGAVAGVLVLVGTVIGLVFAFGGKDDKPVAQNNDPLAKAKANPAPPKLPPPKKASAPEPNADPVEVPVQPPVGIPADTPGGMPEEPPVVVPPQPPADDPFAKAASFKPDGPLPELPPLPTADRRPLLVLDAGGHSAFIKHVFFTPDAARVVSVADDKSVRMWDVASGEVVYTVHLPGGPGVEGMPFSAATSPDGKLLAVGTIPVGLGKSGYPFYVLAVDTGELVATVDGALNVPHALDFSPDGKWLAVGSRRGTLQVYDLASKKWVYEVQAHPDQVSRVRFNPPEGGGRHGRLRRAREGLEPDERGRPRRRAEVRGRKRAQRRGLDSRREDAGGRL